VSSTWADFSTAPLDLGLGESWEHRNGSWWATLAVADVRGAASRLLAQNVRFMTITAIELASHEVRMDYHWDIGGQIVTWSVIADGKQIDSIADLCPAADWAEREIHEYFAVEFPGRIDTKPLMLRMGDTLGINLHEGGAE
jgi:NADH:ubiquinone oxidoreductase subunit C